jgi:8-oxo-dGTP pyrophosphatase MutT (NUDIX family)
MRSIHREIVGGFIFSNDGYVLLGKSKPGGVYPGYAMIPGGGVDEGETKVEAVTREMLEEVGLDIKDADIKLVNDTQSGESEKTLRDTHERVFVLMHFNDFYITMPKPAAELPLTSGDDFMDARWVPTADLPKLKLTDPTQITLRKLGYLQ